MPRINRAPAPEDIALGAVLWLPPKHEVEAALRKTNNPDMGTSPVRIITHPGSDPSESFYDHPIMVVSRPANDPDRIHFVPLTTFGGKGLWKRYDEYLPIAPAPPNPRLTRGVDPTYQTLTLRDDLVMDKLGYVQISSVYSMQWRGATRYQAANALENQNATLNEDSLDLLLNHIVLRANYNHTKQYQPPVRTIVHEWVRPPVAIQHNLATPPFLVHGASGRTTLQLDQESTSISQCGARQIAAYQLAEQFVFVPEVVETNSNLTPPLLLPDAAGSHIGPQTVDPPVLAKASTPPPPETLTAPPSMAPSFQSLKALIRLLTGGPPHPSAKSPPPPSLKAPPISHDPKGMPPDERAKGPEKHDVELGLFGWLRKCLVKS